MVGSLARPRLWGRTADPPWWLAILEQVAVCSFVLIPLSIGVAILKHGLYEIDVVINKAVVFGALGVLHHRRSTSAIVVGVGPPGRRG